MSFSPLQHNSDWVRRDVLKGLSLGAGATLLAPLIQQAVALAEGKSAGVRRVVFVLQSNGLRPSFITPSGHTWKESREGGSTGGELVELSLRERELPAALEPLTPLKDRITLLQGLSGRIAYSDHSANHGALGCYSARGVHGQTIDSALAAALPAVFPHVLLGLGANGSEAINYAHSAQAANKPLPTICSPSLAFRSLFGSVDGGGKAEFDRQTNLLDFLADDVNRLAAALPASERGKLESYAEAFESLYTRQREIASLQNVIRRHAPDLGEKRTTTTSSLVLEAQFEIATAALIAGLTNVVTLTSGSGHQRFGQYPELGAADLHNLGHGGSIAGKTNEESFILIHQIHTRLIAGMAQKLSKIPEGNGSMLDNTLIVFMSDSGDGHHPRLYSWPIVLIGDWGGRLKQGGRYLEFPAYGQNKHATIGSLYATLLLAAGQPCEKFGHDDIKILDIRQGEPLQDLLA